MFLPFLLTLIAGISTLIGFLFIFIKGKQSKIIAYSFSFAAGVMITVSIFDLIPEAFKEICHFQAFLGSFLTLLIGINTGIVFAHFLEKNVSKTDNSTLYKIGITSMIAIIMHNIPEGIATFLTSSNNLNLGIKLTIAIALHNIPEGISISIPIYYATKSKKKAFLYTLISGLSEGVGGIIAFIILRNIINDLFMGFLYSIIAGIMITISIKELLKEANKLEKIFKNSIFYIIGSLIMYLSIKLI